METANLEIYVYSNLYCAGLTEDGTEYHAESYRVVAEDKDGNRWEHRTGFAGCEKVWDDEVGAYGFLDIREQAASRAERLCSRIKAASRIDLQHWSLGRPVYGSKAYVEYGADDDIAWERKFAA